MTRSVNPQYVRSRRVAFSFHRLVRLPRIRAHPSSTDTPPTVILLSLIPPPHPNPDRFTVSPLSSHIPSSPSPPPPSIPPPVEVLTVDTNFFEGDMPSEVCDLRGVFLRTLTAECLADDVGGVDLPVTCSVPTCCTECF